MSEGDAETWSPGRPAAVLNLMIDAMTGRIVTALREAGIPSLLLKGPVIARRLYHPGQIRPYADCDLLVRRSDLARAEATVAALGMRRNDAEERTIPAWERHHHSWRLDRRYFDLELHWTLLHIGADSDMFWEVCNRDCRPMRVGGVEVATPDDPQLALILALHAAQHAASWNRPQEDLRRALEHFPPEVWRAAAQRAFELDTVPALAAGLRLIPGGEVLAEALSLPAEYSFELLLTTGHAGEGAPQIDRLLRAPGPRAKARVVLRAAFPAPGRVRARHMAADRDVRLARAYAMELIRIVRIIGLGVPRWRQARRRAAGVR